MRDSDDQNIAVLLCEVNNQMSAVRMNAHRWIDVGTKSREPWIVCNQLERCLQASVITFRLPVSEKFNSPAVNGTNILSGFAR